MCKNICIYTFFIYSILATVVTTDRQCKIAELKIVAASSSFPKTQLGKVIDGKVSTSVRTRARTGIYNWMLFKLESASHVYVKSVIITPARPTGAENCVFPFNYNNKNYYSCIRPEGFCNSWCRSEYREGKIINCTGQEWIEGELADNIEILTSKRLTIHKKSINWNNFQSCGNTKYGYYADRNVNCSENSVSSKYVAIRKKYHIRLAEIKIQVAVLKWATPLRTGKLMSEPTASETNNNKKNKNNTIIILSILLTITMIVAAALAATVLYRVKRYKPRDNNLRETPENKNESIGFEEYENV